MANNLKYVTFETALGWVGLLASENGLLAVTLPRETAEEARQMPGSGAGEAVLAPDFFNGTVERLQAYFSGEKVEFPEKLDLSEATSFQRTVWEKTQLIPYGKTRSYQWVARQIGNPGAVRAVGRALGRNPLPVIVPCHRVIASNGSLGGFTGGLEMKKRLLELEGESE
jgi:methylated-DNA-[protein]-cysteine S-methyltransferase